MIYLSLVIFSVETTERLVSAVLLSNTSYVLLQSSVKFCSGKRH